jgi:hypothetical protein
MADSPSKTMTGQMLTTPAIPTVAPVVPLSQSPGVLDQQAAIQAGQDRLNAIIKSHPEWDVNIADRMKGIVSEAQAQKVPAQMSPIAAAIATFGAPQLAPAILDRKSQIEKQQAAKDDQLLQMKHDILTAQIGQDMEKGKFEKALAALHETAMTKTVLDAHTKRQALEDAQTKEDQKQSGREALVRLRGDEMRQTVTARAKQLAAQFHLPEKLVLARAEALLAQGNKLISNATTYNQAYDKYAINTFDYSNVLEQVNGGIDEMIRQMVADAKTPGGGGATPPAAAKSDPLGIR